MSATRIPGPRNQRGVTLIIVMVILVIVTILGLGGAQLALSGERSTRFDRDNLIATQAAEAALMDAQADISTGTRAAEFVAGNAMIFGTSTCGTGPAANATSNRGLCARPADTAKPIWATVDFTNTGGSAPTVNFGDFTSRTFQSGSVGVQPVQAPRYIVEAVPDPALYADATSNSKIYRITAMGFGPNLQVQVVTQIAYRKP